MARVISVDLDQAPAALAEALELSLVARGYAICRVLAVLSEQERREFIAEVGRNLAIALAAISPDY